jgi:cellulose synthase (UDP-forming)
MTPPLPQSNWATVDIFVTCYNEPPELVEQTTRAALAIDYPVTKLRVYILDDGNSPEMRAMAQKLGVEDLQSAQLQAEVVRIKAERSLLLEQLERITNLASDTDAAEQFLQHHPADHPVLKIFQTFQNLAIVLDFEHSSITAQLGSEQQKLKAAIYQKELELTELVRCRYIARPKPANKPHHAKAGSINYAIFSGETTGTFILTLDADHIPKPQFLKRVLPYFYTYNPQVGRYEANQIALVQTPQDFYNLPANDPFGHRAHLFYGPIQQC